MQARSRARFSSRAKSIFELELCVCVSVCGYVGFSDRYISIRARNYLFAFVAVWAIVGRKSFLIGARTSARDIAVYGECNEICKSSCG